MAQNTYSRSYKINADWEQLVHKYIHCRKLNKKKIGKTIKTILIGILVIALILSGFTIAGLIGYNFNTDSSVEVVTEEYVNEIEE